jgi:hypothetical protein
MKLDETVSVLSAKLKVIRRHWDGREAVSEMKRASFPHWKQMEWPGFYFQYLCEGCLRGIMEMPGPKYGRAAFDAYLEIPWDFKAHAENTSSHQIIVNDTEAVTSAQKQYGHVGVILAVGPVEYNDDERSFQKWWQELKGGLSEYERKRIERGAWSRLRKVSFSLEEIDFLVLDAAALARSGSFQKNFRNADGSLRRSKVLIDLEKLGREVACRLKF